MDRQDAKNAKAGKYAKKSKFGFKINRIKFVFPLAYFPPWRSWRLGGQSSFMP
jgi:hypothetical protein